MYEQEIQYSPGNFLDFLKFFSKYFLEENMYMDYMVEEIREEKSGIFPEKLQENFPEYHLEPDPEEAHIKQGF